MVMKNKQRTEIILKTKKELTDYKNQLALIFMNNSNVAKVVTGQTNFVKKSCPALPLKV